MGAFLRGAIQTRPPTCLPHPHRPGRLRPRRCTDPNWRSTRLGLWRDEPKTSMWSMAVVVLDVGVERALELAATEDQHPVEALAPCRADEALRERVGLRGLHRCSDDRDPLASKDLIERIGQL